MCKMEDTKIFFLRYLSDVETHICHELVLPTDVCSTLTLSFRALQAQNLHIFRKEKVPISSTQMKLDLFFMSYTLSVFLIYTSYLVPE